MIDKKLDTYPTFLDELFRALPIWIVAFFETITNSLPTLILWLTAIYGVLQIVRIVRVMIRERKEDATHTFNKNISRKGKRSINKSIDE
jgi:hypothetical protein